MDISKMHHISKMTWADYNTLVSDSILILPVGATEQHGLHLPLGVDTIIPESFAESIADQLGAAIAPTLSYGYKSQPSSGGGPLFPGTVDLNGATLTNLVRDILAEFLADGWQKIIVINGHFENESFLVEAADLLLRNQQSPFPKVLITNWWNNISPELKPKIFDEVEFVGWELEHAAIVETSLMMHFAPETVHEDRFLDEGLDKVPQYHCFPPSRTLLPASGLLHTPRSSSAGKGRMIAENVIENIVLFIKEEFSK